MIRLIHYALASTLLFAVAAQPAEALMLTGLETGDLSIWSTSPWTIAGSAAELAAVGGGQGDPANGWHATQGKSFGYLMSPRISPVSGWFTMRSEKFSVNEGDRLRFDTFFDSGEQQISGRRVGAQLIGDDGSAKSANDRAVMLYDRSAADLAAYGAEGWTTVSHDFSEAGTYRLEFFMTRNQLAAPLPSAKGSTLGFDDVRIDTQPVPEPGTLALLGSALAMVGLIPRRRR